MLNYTQVTWCPPKFYLCRTVHLEMYNFRLINSCLHCNYNYFNKNCSKLKYAQYINKKEGFIYRGKIILFQNLSQNYNMQSVFTLQMYFWNIKIYFIYNFIYDEIVFVMFSFYVNKLTVDYLICFFSSSEKFTKMLCLKGTDNDLKECWMS